MYVETDFVTGFVKEDDWLREPVLRSLEEHDDLVTSIVAVAELLVVLYDRGNSSYEIDAPRAITDLLEVVPIVPEQDEEAVIAAAGFLEDHGLTPFDALHAGVVATRGTRVLSTEQDYDELGLNRVPLKEEYGS